MMRKTSHISKTEDYREEYRVQKTHGVVYHIFHKRSMETDEEQKIRQENPAFLDGEF